MPAKKYLLRQGILFFNALLLAFEPTAWAVSKPAQMQTRDFLEATEITKREVRLSEFFQKIQGDLPENVRGPLEQAVKLYPNAVLPKFTVTKINGTDGEQDIQVQFVKDKKSAVITIVGRGSVFAKVGSSVITNEDMKNPGLLFAKLNKEFPDTTPKKALGYKFKVLSSGDFAALPPKDQKDYIKKLRKVLESAEHLQTLRAATAQGKGYTGIFDLLENEAFAASQGGDFVHNSAAAKELTVGASCIYAGHIADYGCKNGPPKGGKCSSGNGYKCGGEGSDFAKRLNDQSDLGCMSGQGIRCNSSIYGDSKDNCVKRSNDATKECNDKTSKFDYFEAKQYTNSKEWDAQKDKLDELVNKQKAFCSALDDNPTKALADQAETCRQLKARIQEIQETVCPFGKSAETSDEALKSYKRNERFKGSYCEKDSVIPKPEPVPEHCTPKNPGPAEPPTTGGGTDGGGGSKPPPAPPANPPPVVAPPGTTECPKDGSGGGTVTPPPPAPGPNEVCDNSKWIAGNEKEVGECTASKGKVVTCNQGTSKEDKNFWKCDCGVPPENMQKNYFDVRGIPFKCTIVRGSDSGSGSGGAGGTSGRAKKDSGGLAGFWKDNKSWLLPTALGVGLLGFWYYGSRKSLKSAYDFMTPQATATPVPSTTDTVRTRGTR